MPEIQASHAFVFLETQNHAMSRRTFWLGSHQSHNQGSRSRRLWRTGTLGVVLTWNISHPCDEPERSGSLDHECSSHMMSYVHTKVLRVIEGHEQDMRLSRRIFWESGFMVVISASSGIVRRCKLFRWFGCPATRWLHTAPQGIQVPLRHVVHHGHRSTDVETWRY